MSNVSLRNVEYGNCMCEVLPSVPLPCPPLSPPIVGGVRDLHFAVEISFRFCRQVAQQLLYYFLVMLKKRSSIYFN